MKKLLKRVLFPPVWVLSLFTVLSAATLIYVFVNGLEVTVAAYVSYAFSFYTLLADCMFFLMILPKRYRVIKQKIYLHPLGNKYMTDDSFRTQVSLYASLGVNLMYAAINILSFILYRSVWFVILAGYYAILALMRFLLVRSVNKNGIGRDKRGELKSTVTCSCVLLTLNFVLSGAVLMILYQNKSFSYNGVLIYVMAAYTFYITGHAITDIIKYRKYSSPVMLITKVIALSAALVSMLALETAMLSQFGQEMASGDRWIMIAATGAGVSCVVVTMSVYMIARSLKEIKMLKE